MSRTHAILLPPLALALIAAFELIASHGFVRMEDDAFYYFLVVRNILEIGESSVMAGVPTNGYHPLWVVVLTAWTALFGEALFGVRILELALFFSGLLIALWALSVNSVIVSTALSVAMYFVWFNAGSNGMEIALLFATVPALLGVVLHAERMRPVHAGVFLFLAAGAVIGSRLEAAVFALPLVVIAPIALYLRAVVLLGLALTAVGYLAFNSVLFDSPLPVSGLMKGLGADGWNDLFVAQVRLALTDPLAAFLFGDVGVLTWPFLLGGAALFVLSLVHLRYDAQARRHRLIFILFVAAFLVLSARILFQSSWRIWSWYDFPAIFLALGTIAMFSDLARHSRPIALAGLATAITVGGLNLYIWTAPKIDGGYFEVNRAFATRVKTVTGERPIAMGDRAGLFAWVHEGGLYQLEGLVNSAAYVRELKSTDDLRPIICAAGVRHVVAWDRALPEGYDSHAFEVMRAGVTTFEGPRVTVRGSEEQLRLTSAEVLGARVRPYDDQYIYLWELDC